MTANGWSEARLRRLFDRYRTNFFSNRLRGFRVENRDVREIAGAIGFCDSEKRLIVVDAASHTSDREVRSTLLHEMAHAAAGARSRGHDSRFFVELEALLRAGAPISVGLPENPRQPLLSSIPTRFPLSRRAFGRIYSRRAREIESLSTEVEFVGGETIGVSFRDAGVNGITWEDALLALGLEYGLLDVDLKPIPATRRKLAYYSRCHTEGAAIRTKMMESRNPAARKRPRTPDGQC